MQANELRIGNIVRRKDNLQNDKGTDPVTVISIHEQGINKGEAFEHFIDNIEGIPLTKEWLLKFGFKFKPMKNKKEMMKNGWEDLSCHWIKMPDDYKLEIFHDGSNDCTHTKSQQIHFVHQLQNLYFALTGEELTMK